MSIVDIIALLLLVLGAACVILPHTNLRFDYASQAAGFIVICAVVGFLTLLVGFYLLGITYVTPMLIPTGGIQAWILAGVGAAALSICIIAGSLAILNRRSR
jgi:hypothetical protein